MSAYLIYIGKNKGTIPGVPARDLTEAEAKNYGIDDLLKSGLYVKVAKDLPKIDIVFETEEEPKRYRSRRHKE